MPMYVRNDIKNYIDHAGLHHVSKYIELKNQARYLNPRRNEGQPAWGEARIKRKR